MDELDPEAEETIFEAALQAATEYERERVLSQLCGDNRSLQQRIEALLEAYNHSDAFEPPSNQLGGLLKVFGSLEGQVLGNYQILERLGEGGMGEVYLARSQSPGRMMVALKVIKPGMDTRQVIARFELERRSLQRLDHPNIAKHLHSGVTDSGRAYFVMELVRGIPITTYCERHRLSVEQRLRLFVDLCSAVQHANANGLVHRDLTPNNLLVVHKEERPQVKVIDFGVAKALTAEPSCHSVFTGAVQWLGTPTYMSPEQAKWSSDVDVRSDVYSLGVLLFELLTGSTPLQIPAGDATDLDTLRKLIVEQAAPRPSDRVLAAPHLVEGRTSTGLSAKQLRELLRPKLDWIVLKALEKPKEQRYRSAGELADDVTAYLNRQPIKARPPGLARHLEAYLRHAVSSAWTPWLLSATAAAAVVFLFATLRQPLESDRPPVPDAPSRATLRSTASQAAVAEDVRKAARFLKIGDVDDARRTLAAVDEQGANSAIRFALGHLRRQSSSPTTQPAHTDLVLSADESPDGRYVASSDKGGEIIVWDQHEQREVRRWQAASSELTSLQYSPNGRWLAVAGKDKCLQVWRVSDWSLAFELYGHDNTINSLAWAPDSNRIATGDRGGDVRIWDTNTSQFHRPVERYPDVIDALKWSPSGKYLAVTCQPVGVQVLKTSDWQLHFDIADPTLDALALDYSPDEELIAAAGWGGRVIVADMRDGQLRSSVIAPAVSALAFGPADEIYLGTTQGELRVLQAYHGNRSWEETHHMKLPAENGYVRRIIYERGGKSIGVAVGNSVLWKNKEAILGHSWQQGRNATSIGCSSDLNCVFRLQEQRRLVLDKSDLQENEFPFSLPLHHAAPDYLPDRQLLCTAGRTGNRSMLFLYNLYERTVTRQFPLPVYVRHLAFCDAGEAVVLSSNEGHAYVWYLDTGYCPKLSGFDSTQDVLTAASRANESFLICAADSRTVQCRSIHSLKPIAQITTDAAVSVIRYSTRGDTVAICEMGRLSVWSADLSQRLWTVPLTTPHAPVPACCVCFSEDDTALAVLLEDGTVKLIDAELRSEVLSVATLNRPSHKNLWWLAFVRGDLVMGHAASEILSVIPGGDHVVSH